MKILPVNNYQTQNRNNKQNVNFGACYISAKDQVFGLRGFIYRVLVEAQEGVNLFEHLAPHDGGSPQNRFEKQLAQTFVFPNEIKMINDAFNEGSYAGANEKAKEIMRQAITITPGKVRKVFQSVRTMLDAAKDAPEEVVKSAFEEAYKAIGVSEPKKLLLPGAEDLGA